MADFIPSLDLLLKHEGGYSNNPNDPGGPTKYGISLRFLRSQKVLPADFDDDGDIDIEDIKDMTLEEASSIYKMEFWDKLGISRILDQRIANMVFGIAVNTGPNRSISILQKAIDAICAGDVSVDGCIGDKTIKAVNSINSLKLLLSLKLKCASFYQSLVTANPKLRIFLKGWLNRVNSY